MGVVVVRRARLGLPCGVHEGMVGNRAEVRNFRRLPDHVILRYRWSRGARLACFYELLGTIVLVREAPVNLASDTPDSLVVAATQHRGSASLGRTRSTFVPSDQFRGTSCNIRQMGITPSAGNNSPQVHVSLVEKLSLVARVWAAYAAVRLALRDHPLPEAVARLGVATGRSAQSTTLLSHAVSRALRIGPWTPRCLTRSLVLYRLLRMQGTPAQLIIGLPSHAREWDAHAWVELDGQDVGPKPGRSVHQELARYPVDLTRGAKPHA